MIGGPYLEERAAREQEFVESTDGGGVEHQQSAGRSCDAMEIGDAKAQAGDGGGQDGNLQRGECRVESRPDAEDQRRGEEENEQIRHDEPQNLVREELEENSIAAG